MITAGITDTGSRATMDGVGIMRSGSGTVADRVRIIRPHGDPIPAAVLFRLLREEVRTDIITITSIDRQREENICSGIRASISNFTERNGRLYTPFRFLFPLIRYQLENPSKKGILLILSKFKGRIKS